MKQVARLYPFINPSGPLEFICPLLSMDIKFLNADFLLGFWERLVKCTRNGDKSGRSKNGKLFFGFLFGFATKHSFEKIGYT